MSNLPVPPKIIGRVRAVYPYYSEEKSSLSFRKGDFIDVLAKLESGWWDGWCNGERGWFPSNYVEIIKDNLSGPPDRGLPPKPMNNNRSSMYSSSTGSESSRANNMNLPDGWSIQMTDDRRQWYYYNELTGEVTHQNPLLAQESEDTIDRKEKSFRDSTFYPSQPIEEEIEKHVEEQTTTVPTSKELMDKWVERKTPQGRIYFCNLITQETTWNYDEINTETGCLRKTEESVTEEEKDEEHSKENKDTVQEDTKELTWGKIATDIAFNIHELTTAAQNGKREEVQTKTSVTVESIRLMLYASRALDRDSPLVHEPVFRDPRRSVMSSLSKLVLDSKLSAELSDESSAVMMLEKIQKDANDVLIGVRNFVTACQQRNITINNVSPQLLNDVSQLPFDPYLLESPGLQKTNNPTIKVTSAITTGMVSLGLTPNDRKKLNKVTRETNSSMLQKAKYLLNQDLILSLQVYSHQIYTSAEELSAAAHAIITEYKKDSTLAYADERASSVTHFRTLSMQIGQYIAILDEINLDSIDDGQIPSIATYRVSRKGIYSAVGHMFGAVQALTNVTIDIHDSVQVVDQSVINVENVIETVEQSVIAMVSERKRSMGVNREEKFILSPTASTFNSYASESIMDLQSESGTMFTTTSSQDEGIEGDFGDFNMSMEDSRSIRSNLRRPTLPGISDIVNRRRQQSIRPDDRSVDSTDTLGADHQPDEIEIGPDGSLKGGTLSALVERLTLHDTLDTNFIATFLLTYRSFCTTEEVVSLLESRYSLRPPERLTPEQLEIWTERKQKLVRLRIFNVMKNWLENYYIDEDEHLLPRFEYFTNSYIRDSSEFAANQILTLIKKRTESRGAMKKIVQNPINGPEPIYPKNMQAISLLETDPVEMARQLSIRDFKLYSSVRPIECLGKAWSRDGVHGSIAVNIKQSIQYCNRLTSWVTESILSNDEPKKRAIVIKYWVQVADHCRVLNNYNTCMAILSAFDNSAIGRLKKTWMICSRSTTQTLAHIRKLLGANRNFTEYRDIVHSVNPPCIPFLGIYLQDLTFIEDGNPDYLRKSNNLINFAKRHKVAEVIRELKQFQSFAYNLHTIPEFQAFIKTQLSYEHDVEKLYERSLHLEPRMPETPNSIYLAGNVM